MRSIITLALGAVAGALVGQSQILCPDGGCAITGTWMGGSVVGGLIGLSLAGIIPMKLQRTDEVPDESGSDDDRPADPSA